jgi:threonine aldolase
MTRTVKLFGDGASPEPADYVRELGRLLKAGRLAPDSYAIGGSVEALEKTMARRLGKEAAIYLPTGTLANLLAVRALCGSKPRVVVHEESHLFNDSGDGAAVLAGLALIPAGAGQTCYTASELERILARTAAGKVRSPVGAASVELPVRRLHNRAASLARLREIANVCRRQGIGLHLDGARLQMAAAAAGVPLRRYAELCDTVYLSLYKHLGAPGGAILAGPRRLIGELPHARRMFGASPAHAFLEAAMALDNVRRGADARVAAALRRGRELIRSLNGRLKAFPDGTNVATLYVAASRAASAAARLKKDGILLGAYDRTLGGFAVTFNETLLGRSAAAVAGSIDRALA